AGVPADVGFATKPALARVMLDRALDAGVPARWVAGDEVYGADPGPAGGAGDPAGRLRAGHRRHPAAAHRRRADPRRRPGRRLTAAGLAAAVGRAGCEGP